ncbi:hypothetical protein QEN19_000356 [Hanseniaspora menglaensis]
MSSENISLVVKTESDTPVVKPTLSSTNTLEINTDASKHNIENAEEDGPEKKKQKPNGVFRKDHDYQPLEARDPNLKKRKVAMIFGYAGTGYSGLQINEPHKTIEKEIWNNLIINGYISKDNALDLKKVGWQRCARTDKGVHALGNLVSFKILLNEKDRTSEEIEKEFVEKMNQTLPAQIRMFGLQRVTGGFDAKNSCSSRMYEYLLPSYSFIGPKKDNQGIYQELRDKKFNGGYENYEDLENDKYWESLEEMGFKHFTKEEYEKIKAFKFTTGNEEASDPEKIKVYNNVKKLKQLELQHKHSYRISDNKINHFRMMMSQYLGYHNFHNYTIGQKFKDASSYRYMINIEVENPVIINDIEWLKIKIHGQSFMLHQIRKMIAMAVLSCRYNCSKELMLETFTDKRFNIPKAPPLGLYLNHPIFDVANMKLDKNGHQAIDFDRFTENMNTLQEEHIYDKIYNVEVKENIYSAFFQFVDGFKYNEDIISEQPKDASGNNVKAADDASGNPFAFYINCKKRWDDDIENEVLYLDDSNFKKLKQEEKDQKRLVREAKRNERLALEAKEAETSAVANPEQTVAVTSVETVDGKKNIE